MKTEEEYLDLIKENFKKRRELDENFRKILDDAGRDGFNISRLYEISEKYEDIERIKEYMPKKRVHKGNEK